MFSSIADGLFGKLGMAAFLFQWVQLGLAGLGLYVLVELLLVSLKLRKGETLWSALARYGDGKKYRPTRALGVVERRDESRSEAVSVPVRASAVVEEVAEATVTIQSKVQEQAQVQAGSVTAAQPQQQTFNVEATANMVTDMYAMKSGMLRLLWDQRALEESASHPDGVMTIDILIGSVEKMDVQKVYVMGDTKLRMTEGAPEGSTEEIVRTGYTELVTSHILAAKRTRNRNSEVVLDRLLTALAQIDNDELKRKGADKPASTATRPSE